jgi:hypothetical protein
MMFWGAQVMRGMLVAVLTIAGGGLAFAQGASSLTPTQLVRETVKNEVAGNHGSAKFMYLDRQDDEHGSKTRLTVETAQATASILIAENGKPIPPEYRRSEEARLQGMLDNPDEIVKKQKSERDDAERTNRIMQALPEAFLYESDGEEPSQGGYGKVGDELVRLKFRPNPNYKAPTHTEQVLTGMQGVLLIDAKAHRIAKIDGTLIKEVSFGWGVLGHLNSGGHFLVEQAEAGQGAWEVTRMTLEFSGKILMVKNLKIKSTEVCSNFRTVPSNITFAQATELLKKHESQAAENDLPALGQ